MGVSKVDFAGNTLVDLTGDSVTPATLKKGETAHNAAGEQIIGTMEAGGGTTPGAPGDIIFYDYDGTIVASWTLEELATKTALPDYPSHEGLTCQGWNWSLADLKTANRKMNVGAMYITDDGKTRIYIRLEEGRTSPMLGVCPNGTVTVDWGDGTTPDTLTGTSTTTVKWTPNHAYTAPGKYVIKLTVDGAMGFYGSMQLGGVILRYSSGSDYRNTVYTNSVQKIEIGNGVTSIEQYAFNGCHSLSSTTIPNGVTSIGQYAFTNCYSLSSTTIPNSVTSIGKNAFNGCYSLSSITMPNGVTSIGQYAFSNCYSLSSITMPNGVTSIGQYAFNGCYSLSSTTIPNSVTSIGQSAFNSCYSLSSITIPDGVTSIGESAFNKCSSLSSITIPDGVTSIGKNAFQLCSSLSSITMPNGVTSIASSAFYNCYSVAFYDFTACTSVPTLSNTNAFRNIAEDCQIRVPASLVDAWKTATNWSTYANYIVGV